MSSSTGDGLPTGAFASSETSTSDGDTSGTSGTSSTTDVATTTGAQAVCGDGVVDADEACDDGNQADGDACTNACELAVCGDGILHEGEACDDGQATPTCDPDCTPPQCGDGVLNAAANEECDDGSPGHACSASCTPTEIVSIGVGGDHTCVAFDNGTVRCWGQNEWGALCNGKTADLGDDPGELPVADINNGGQYVVQVVSGGYHSCSRSATGNVRCWGAGSYGVLGYGNANPVCDSPDEVPPKEVDIGTSALDIAAGGLHTCAVVTGNKVRCWGAGASGQLGYGKVENLFYPNKKSDVPGIDGAIQLTLGISHTCVLQAGGEVRCWGQNNHGQLGLGHKDNIGVKDQQMPPPALVLGGPSKQIAAGGYHTCALLETDLTVRCWGWGQYGQLGNGISEPGFDIGDAEGEMPPVAVNLGGPVKQVVAGHASTCALLESGKVKCWGYGGFGSLGYASLDDIDLPGEFPPPDIDFSGIKATLLGSAAGHDNPVSGGRGRHVCALLADKSLRCWGNNEFGKLGYGHQETIGDGETPDSADAGPVPF